MNAKVAPKEAKFIYSRRLLFTVGSRFAFEWDITFKSDGVLKWHILIATCQRKTSECQTLISNNLHLNPSVETLHLSFTVLFSITIVTNRFCGTDCVMSRTLFPLETPPSSACQQLICYVAGWLQWFVVAKQWLNSDPALRVKKCCNRAPGGRDWWSGLLLTITCQGENAQELFCGTASHSQGGRVEFASMNYSC